MKPRTIKAIALEIAKREGKKKQVDIAQITEILGHLSDMSVEIKAVKSQVLIRVNAEVVNSLLLNGANRATKKPKTKVKKA